MGCNLKIRRSQEPPGVTSAADAWQPAGNQPLAAWRRVQAVKLWWEGVWAPHNAHVIRFLDDSSLAWHQDRLWTTASFPGAGSKMSWLLVQPDGRWGGQVRRWPHPSPAFSRWLFPLLVSSESSIWGTSVPRGTGRIPHHAVCCCVYVQQILNMTGRIEVLKHQRGILQDQRCAYWGDKFG